VGTLERLFYPRYYPSQEAMLASLRKFFSPEGDDSRVLCARRISSTTNVEPEQAHESLPLAEEFISSGRVEFIDIGEDERTFSSTAVREGIARGEQEWKRLVTDGIAGYIVEQGLYTMNNPD